MTEHIMQYFAFAHLPQHLQAVSAAFAALADSLVAELPRNPERTVALRKLLEAKDAAVRAAIPEVEVTADAIITGLDIHGGLRPKVDS